MGGAGNWRCRGRQVQRYGGAQRILPPSTDATSLYRTYSTSQKYASCVSNAPEPAYVRPNCASCRCC